MDVHNKAIVYSWCREAVVPYRLAMTRQVRDWLHALRSGDPVTRRLVAEAIDMRTQKQFLALIDNAVEVNQDEHKDKSKS